MSVRDAKDDDWRRAMAAAQSGDEGAYRALLEELVPVIRAQVRAQVADPADAEDVVQNALISIHRGRHTYRPERPFAPWLRAVVRHAVVDSFRQRGRRQARETAFEGIDLLPDPRAIRDPDADALSPELVRALRALPANQREAVELIHLDGLTVAEASARAGVSPGALKVRAHRGYRALRRLLEGVSR